MKKRQIDRKLDEIIDFSGIEHHIDTPVKRYSSGMYVRLAFAVAAHLDSHILIADEVLAVGDAEFQKKALGKMQDLSTGQGRTVLFVSHNMGAVRSLCNSGILLENGKLVFKAKNVNELYQKYIEDDFSSVERSKLIISNTDIKLLENSTFKFECMYIQDSSNNICNYTVSGDKEIYLTIEFSVASIDSRLAVYYRLYSQEGIDLYYSQQNDTDPEKWPVIKNGKNILKTKIPIDLLNEGRYFIELLCSIRGIVSIIPQNTVILGFVVSHNSRKSLFIKEERPGVLKPIIIWENVYRS
jgi:lipopolysaccharide transport system ATP-binding protein